jgi:hypothetical protein
MSTGLLANYFGMLRNPSVPANRVVRKVAILAAAGICGLLYHGIPGFGSWEHAFFTIFIIFIVVMLIAIGGGIWAGALYKAFLRKIGARNSKPSVAMFFAEWLFAVMSPLFGLIYICFCYPLGLSEPFRGRLCQPSGMAHGAFPYFVKTEPRALSANERSVVAILLSCQDEVYKNQFPHLKVVGRCGCRVCPTVFFQIHHADGREQHLISYAGKDHSDGLVVAALLEKDGLLSQLEFYSMDGHEPWGIPDVDTLEPF